MKIFNLSFLLALLVGCVSPATYQEPIIRFQQASTVVIEAARIDYGSANKLERDAFIDQQVTKQSKIILDDLRNEKLRVLDGDQLAVRMATLDALAKHGELLLALSSNDAPARAKDAANSLDDAILKLNSSLGNAPPSDKIKSNAGGFATIAAEVTKLALEAKIVDALNKAIFASDNQVKDLIRLLKEDMSVLYERQRAKLSNERVAATDTFNIELESQKPSMEKLKNAATKIKVTEDSWEKLPLLLGAGPGIDAMQRAHLELVRYAKSKKEPQDLNDLNSAIDNFVSSVRIIADAIKSIH